LIATDIVQTLEQEVLFTLGDDGYRGMIGDVAAAFQIAHQNYTTSHHSNMEHKDSNGNVPGFEDLDDDRASGNGMAQSHLRLEGMSGRSRIGK